VLYHSDGAVRPLLPGIIDCGIDILNPIQHICPGMDRAALQRDFGDQVIFHGGVDNQNVLPFGGPAEVRHETRTCIETLGQDRGYICCSCHNVQAGTPVENVLAMIAEARGL
jgi:uroporphyrinogen decarboxylase